MFVINLKCDNEKISWFNLLNIIIFKRLILCDLKFTNLLNEGYILFRGLEIYGRNINKEGPLISGPSLFSL